MVDTDLESKVKPNTKQNGLFTKTFEERNSLLTDLLDNNHIYAAYNYGWVIVFIWYLHTLSYNYLILGRFSFGLDFFQTSFPKPYLLARIWIEMFLVSFTPYIGFVLWSTIRQRISKNEASSTFFDQIALILFVSHIILYTYYFTLEIYQSNFPPASSVSLLFELVRLKMKFYAFVRANVSRTISYKSDNTEISLFPTVSKYIYFLFAPTLIYQDEYPRAKSIRWNKVAEHFTNFAGSILLFNIMAKHSLIHLVRFSENSFSWLQFLLFVIEFAPISGLVLFNLSYLFFHCWLNAFAEMLRFSDRCFYKDFWRANSLEYFFRAWNMIIYDWLHVYIYNDIYKIIYPNNKLLARLIVFFVSALYHEFILGYTFRIFLPACFVLMFSSGVFLKLVNIKGNLGHVMFLLGMWYGTSALVCGYGIQYYKQLTIQKLS